jgi:hypothetical protein
MLMYANLQKLPNPYVVNGRLIHQEKEASQRLPEVDHAQLFRKLLLHNSLYRAIPAQIDAQTCACSHVQKQFKSKKELTLSVFESGSISLGTFTRSIDDCKLRQKSFPPVKDTLVKEALPIGTPFIEEYTRIDLVKVGALRTKPSDHVFSGTSLLRKKRECSTSGIVLTYRHRLKPKLGCPNTPAF